MAYVPIPKDLTKVKTKVMFNLTKRQLICFTGGALIGVPLVFLLRKPTGNSVAAMCKMCIRDRADVGGCSLLVAASGSLGCGCSYMT